MRLARPSVRLQSARLLLDCSARANSRRTKTKAGVNISGDRCNRYANFQFKSFSRSPEVKKPQENDVIASAASAIAAR